LALAGGPLLGTYRSVRGGHKLNYALLCALMSDASAWTRVEGEMPRPVPGHAEMASRLAPAFGPEMSSKRKALAAVASAIFRAEWRPICLGERGLNQRRRGDKGKPVEPRVGDGIHPIYGWAFSDHRRCKLRARGDAVFDPCTGGPRARRLQPVRQGHRRSRRARRQAL